MNKRLVYDKNINNPEFNRILELTTPHVALVDGDMYEEEYYYRDSEMFRPQLDHNLPTK